jgi:pilus assembly protein Flp/PilA
MPAARCGWSSDRGRAVEDGGANGAWCAAGFVGIFRMRGEGVVTMLERVCRRDRGQGLVEYALILALVAIVVIGILILLGPAIGSIFSNVSSAL